MYTTVYTLYIIYILMKKAQWEDDISTILSQMELGRFLTSNYLDKNPFMHDEGRLLINI